MILIVMIIMIILILILTMVIRQFDVRVVEVRVGCAMWTCFDMRMLSLMRHVICVFDVRCDHLLGSLMC